MEKIAIASTRLGGINEYP